jgi:hypothetical protein
VIPTFHSVLADDGLNIQDLTDEQTVAMWFEYDRLIGERVEELRGSPDLQGSLGLLNRILVLNRLQLALRRPFSGIACDAGLGPALPRG